MFLQFEFEALAKFRECALHNSIGAIRSGSYVLVCCTLILHCVYYIVIRHARGAEKILSASSGILIGRTIGITYFTLVLSIFEYQHISEVLVTLDHTLSVYNMVLSDFVNSYCCIMMLFVKYYNF